MKNAVKVALLLSSLLLGPACAAYSDPDVASSSTFESSITESSFPAASSSTFESSGSSSSSTHSSTSYDVQFSDISNYSLSIGNASSLGLVKRKTSSPSAFIVSDSHGSSENDDEQVDVFVKTTSEYDSNDPVANEDGTVDVTFTRIDTTKTTTVTNGKKTLVAAKKPNQADESPIINRGEGFVEFSSNSLFEYRLTELSTNRPLSSWMKGTDATLSIATDVQDFMIETRSLDAYVAMKEIPGWEYGLIGPTGETIYSFGEKAWSSKDGVISFDGLVEGLAYTITYHGIGEETIVKQSRVDAKILKFYACGRFAFIMYVPADSKESRPEGSKLKYDKDGIPFTDKEDYYSGKDAQSFVVDNLTGLQYKIPESTRIKEIHNGFITLVGSKLVYEFGVSGENFYLRALFTNETITCYDAYRDSFGNVFIYNDKLDYEDEGNRIVFYTNFRRFIFDGSGVIEVKNLPDDSLNNFWYDPPCEFQRVGPDLFNSDLDTKTLQKLSCEIRSADYSANRSCTIGLELTVEGGYGLLRTIGYGTGVKNTVSCSFYYVKFDGSSVVSSRFLGPEPIDKFDAYGFFGPNIFWVHTRSLNKLFWANIDDALSTAFDEDFQVLSRWWRDDNKWALLAENASIDGNVINFWLHTRPVFTVNTPMGFDEYTLVLGDNKKPELVLNSSVIYEPTEIILQPINR